MQIHPIFLALHPTASVTRDVKDALYEFLHPQSAASYLFRTKPASSLSHNWDIIIVVDTIAYHFSIDGGAHFIPIKPQLWREMKRGDLNWIYPKIGSTAYSIEGITRKAIQISWPMKYSLYPETAQSFSHVLFESIRLPTLPQKLSHFLTTLPGDIHRGLDHTPTPISTLLNRLKYLLLLTLLSVYAFFLTLIPKNMPVTAKQMEVDMLWMMGLIRGISITLLFLWKMGMRLVAGMVVLVLERDVEKAVIGLRVLAADVRRFDGLEAVGGAGKMRSTEDLGVYNRT